LEIHFTHSIHCKNKEKILSRRVEWEEGQSAPFVDSRTKRSRAMNESCVGLPGPICLPEDAGRSKFFKIPGDRCLSFSFKFFLHAVRHAARPPQTKSPLRSTMAEPIKDGLIDDSQSALNDAFVTRAMSVVGMSFSRSLLACSQTPSTLRLTNSFSGISLYLPIIPFETRRTSRHLFVV
jgi:hypothetical protein